MLASGLTSLSTKLSKPKLIDTMKFLLIVSLLFCIALIQSLPVNITKSTTAKPTKTSTKTYDIYDEYDEKFYKDYYSDDYLAEVVEKERKAAALESEKAKSEQIFPLKTTTPKSDSVVEIISSTKKNAQILETHAIEKSTLKPNVDEYDLSDYYDYYDDYADESVTEKAQPSSTKLPQTTSTKKLAIIIEKKLPAKQSSTKPSIDDKTYDYNEYYDDYKLSETVTTTVPSLVNKKIILVGSSPSAIKTTTPLDSKKEKNKSKNSTSALDYEEYYEDEYYHDNKNANYDYYDDDYEYKELGNIKAEEILKTSTPSSIKSNTNLTVVETTTKTPNKLDFYEDDYEDEYYDYDQYDYGYSDTDKKIDPLGDSIDKIVKPVESTTTKPIVLPDLKLDTTRPTKNPIDIFEKQTTKKSPKQQVTEPTTTTKPATRRTTPKEELLEPKDIDYYNELIDVNSKKTNKQNETLLKGDLTLKELIKSPALLAGIFGGLLLGLVTALLLLIFIIYRIRQRKYDESLKYDLNTKITNENYYSSNDCNNYHKKSKRSKSKKRGLKTKVNLESSELAGNNQNLLSSSQLSTPSNNASSTTSNTGLLNGQILSNNDRLMKYTAQTNTSSLRIVSNVLSGSSSTESPNHDGSFNYAYIKAPTKEFYA